MTKKDKWFNYENINKDSEYNLFCFPHAGSGASSYASWGNSIPEKYSFYPIQYPMRENRIKIKMPDSIKELAERIADENKDIFTSKPAVFYGHCYGAVVAYETALCLKEKYGFYPELLIVASSESPRISEDTVTLAKADNNEVAEFFIRLGYMNPASLENKVYMDFFMPVLKNDYILLQQYAPDDTKKINSKIYAVYSPEDAEMRLPEIEKWKNFTENDIAVSGHSGGHFFLNENNVKEFFENISDSVLPAPDGRLKVTN